MHIQTDDVACSTCGSREADEVGRSRDYEFESCDNEFVFVCCRACGLTYLRNRPALDTLGIIYPPSYYRYAAFLGPVTTRLRGIVQGARVRMIRRLLGAGATVMEVGCGEGQLLQAIKAERRSVMAGRRRGHLARGLRRAATGRAGDALRAVRGSSNGRRARWTW